MTAGCRVAGLATLVGAAIAFAALPARARTVASTDAPTDLGTGPRAVEAPAGGVVV